tara:strand:+ start:281 stop:460 length:180 start_codon:yes stop_codon:yes gene_type:complete
MEKCAYFSRGTVIGWNAGSTYHLLTQIMMVTVIDLAKVFLFPQIALWLLTYSRGQQELK